MAFESEKPEHFFNNVLPNLDEKLKKYKWKIIDVNDPQKAAEFNPNKNPNELSDNKKKVLAQIAAMKFPDEFEKKTVVCLMLNDSTEWKWAWCIAQAGTHNFIGCLSDKFKNRTKAIEWLDKQMN